MGQGALVEHYKSNKTPKKPLECTFLKTLGGFLLGYGKLVLTFDSKRYL